MKPSVAIVGAGFAGIATAVYLARAGVKVTLIDKNPRLGGRCLSFPDPTTGDMLDSGQHLIMGCYRETLALTDILKTRDKLKSWPLRLTWKETSGRIHTLSGEGPAASLRLMWGLARLKLLGWRDRWAIIKALYQIRKTDPTQYSSLNRKTCSQWLKQLNQTQGAMAVFWRPLIISTLNEEPDRAAANNLARVVKDALLAGPGASRFLLPRQALQDLYTPNLENYLESRESQVLLKKSVQRITVDHDIVTGLTTADGESISATCYVMALPPWALERILPDPEESGLDGIRSMVEGYNYSPILTIYLWLNRRLFQEPMISLLGSPLHWLFDLPTCGDADRQRISIVISASRQWIDNSPKDILEETYRELSRYFPEFRQSTIHHARVVKDRRATVSFGPGSLFQRPETETGCPNLFLAGDWTATGLPATIESAVLSGRQCAETILRKTGMEE